MAAKRELLRDVLLSEGCALIAGAHDGLSARLAEANGFDAIWASGLGISAVRAVPDASILTMTAVLEAATTIDRATALAVVADCDTGFGDVNVAVRAARRFSRAGIAGICLEDKQFPKRNSFTKGHRLADPAALQPSSPSCESAYPNVR